MVLNCKLDQKTRLKHVFLSLNCFHIPLVICTQSAALEQANLMDQPDLLWIDDLARQITLVSHLLAYSQMPPPLRGSVAHREDVPCLP